MEKLPFERELKILTRKEAETDPSFGVMPEKRSTEELLNYGVLTINKPQGPT